MHVGRSVLPPHYVVPQNHTSSVLQHWGLVRLEEGGRYHYLYQMHTIFGFLVMADAYI